MPSLSGCQGTKPTCVHMPFACNYKVKSSFVRQYRHSATCFRPRPDCKFRCNVSGYTGSLPRSCYHRSTHGKSTRVRSDVNRGGAESEGLSRPLTDIESSVCHHNLCLRFADDLPVPAKDFLEVLLLISPFFFWGTSMVAMKVCSLRGDALHAYWLVAYPSSCHLLAGSVTPYNPPLCGRHQAVTCRFSSAVVGSQGKAATASRVESMAVDFCLQHNRCDLFPGAQTASKLLLLF